MDTKLWIHFDEHMDVVGHHFQRLEPRALLQDHCGQDCFQSLVHGRNEHRASVFRRDQTTWKAHWKTTVGSQRRLGHHTVYKAVARMFYISRAGGAAIPMAKARGLRRSRELVIRRS